MLVASDPTVLIVFCGFPVVTLRCVSDHDNTHTIAICNNLIDEVTQIWALELATDPAFHQTLDLLIQANTIWHFLATFKVFLQAVGTGDASLYLPLAAAACHFMWYTPNSYQPGQPGLPAPGPFTPDILLHVGRLNGLFVYWGCVLCLRWLGLPGARKSDPSPALQLDFHVLELPVGLGADVDDLDTHVSAPKQQLVPLPCPRAPCCQHPTPCKASLTCQLPGYSPAASSSQLCRGAPAPRDRPQDMALIQST
ncbi:hypothetical protein DSO57_1030552 [Entomophthora muscae]|uniref:Uncharacterized protein n=1 Tax=Entomophthora muscae TaxID=34485 RepID=A0ACC2TZD0_9FUNG|nr:hypothetical protein DSO57_1030552 [Entomophthora muscae]